MKLNNGSLIYFGQDAIDACPDGWTCAITGETHMPDEDGYYVYITEEGCIEYASDIPENSTLCCPHCGSTLIADNVVEIPCLDCLRNQ
jgi:hypothetical protein